MMTRHGNSENQSILKKRIRKYKNCFLVRYINGETVQNCEEIRKETPKIFLMSFKNILGRDKNMCILVFHRDLGVMGLNKCVEYEKTRPV